MNRVLVLLFFSLLFTQVYSQELKWLDSNLDMETRISSLIDEMTLDEKISQTVNASAGIERLSIDEYNWWSEALHGVARSGRATVFPQAIGLGATFDPVLIESIGCAISDEARAINNHLLNSGKNQTLYQGLTFWSPNVNIFRDPRWGRGQETYGEDPYLSGTLGASFIKGMQGDHPKYLKVATCAKHFAVHSGPEALRHEFNAIANDKDLRETYLPAFKKCVDAGVEAVMCAYNRTNDEGCCGSNVLLKDILIDEWNFEGHIVSDCGALENFHKKHGLTSSSAESAALALRSGVNLNCGDTYQHGLKSAIEQGLITEQDLDKSLARLLGTRFKLGMFDEADVNPYRAIGTDAINSKENKQLALESAHKSIVLLKNNNTLPLKKESNFIYLTGPLASNTLSLVGNYNGINSDMRTILEGVAAKVSPSTRLQYRQGALLTTENKNSLDWYSGQAKDADATIVVLGLTLLLEGEEGESIASSAKGDILDMSLPESQLNLLRKISARAKSNNKKVVTVICAGMPLDLREISELSDAVLYAWYPGERGGDAVADILFGDVSPSGKLPITFPKSVDQLPDYDDYSMVGRTYKYMKVSPLYPFGFGLGYADLTWKNLRVSNESVKKNETVEISIEIENEKGFKADEVVQLYVSIQNNKEQLPNSTLIDFKRITIEGHGKSKVDFSIPYEAFVYFNDYGQRIQHKGKAKLVLSNSSPCERSKDLGAALFETEVRVN
ncbi:glycoside hydrolase family 3 C-terminal domain-containing protein [Carboxylicivirga sp. A043]|uniref:glycoside hydrolase family 3 N-terminal domain-containing protein n=1 Tax=Carboxylicivirga litoralis TaxID=2816963 RepID=UPI0021CB0DEE|nr:glycoside hydrolase family 3 N-terminal domain-containing protein [Carboxylicivirga sp. A043]MCU4157875.1 glycoside hydrolase family 3 C-terminal domain-containing protein [Carboxylicivirga sp. A043]